MRLVTAAESLEIDRQSQGLFASDHWMEIAGRLMAGKIHSLCDPQKPLLFLCGPGNNGGDGYVTIKNLLAMGHRNIQIVRPSASSALNQQKYAELAQYSFKVWTAQSVDEKLFKELLSRCVVIDAVFGVGLSREIENPWKNIFQWVNKKSKLAISLDIPSGLEATTGNVLGEAIRADHTLVVKPFKSGLFLNAGPVTAGKLHKIDLRFPKEIVEDCARSVRLIGARTCEGLRPRRRWSSNKTLFGHTVVVGGSAGLEGAAILAAEAALRAGAGYVSVFSDSKKMHHRAPAEILLHPLQEFEKLFNQKKISSVVFGPGLKTSKESEKIFESLRASSIPVVLDAGGFEYLKQDIKLPNHWAFTPHAGELSRLMNIPAAQLERNRLQSAERACREFGGICVFKGFRTVVHFAGKNYIMDSGNPSLAKSGTGDVLAGIIGSYMAQGLSPEKATALGAWVHGHLADRRLRSGASVNSLIASDLIEELKKF